MQDYSLLAIHHNLGKKDNFAPITKTKLKLNKKITSISNH